MMMMMSHSRMVRKLCAPPPSPCVHFARTALSRYSAARSRAHLRLTCARVWTSVHTPDACGRPAFTHMCAVFLWRAHATGLLLLTNAKQRTPRVLRLTYGRVCINQRLVLAGAGGRQTDTHAVIRMGTKRNFHRACFFPSGCQNASG